MSIQKKWGLLRMVAIGLFMAGLFIFTRNVIYAANLISNSEFETSGINGLPVDWGKGMWGKNTAVFDYPVTGVKGTKAAKVTINQHTTGDAKWYFKNVPVTPGKQYVFSDYYMSNVSTYITVQFKMNDGSFTYKDIAQPGPQASFTPISATFIVPRNVQSVTVFHLINKVGSLTTDNYSLDETSSPTPPPPPPPPTNPIPNPGVENQSSSNPSFPQSWNQGGWGTNQRTFTYPVSGFNSARAVKVDIASYTNGDAKWYFLPIPVAQGEEYKFVDYYKSDIPSYIVAQITLSNGTNVYENLANYSPSSDWKEAHGTILMPANAISLTVFHLIKNVGFLTADNFSLTKLPSGKFAHGMVTWTFDDGLTSRYQNGIPILNAAGLKSSQYIISGNFALPGYITPQQMLTMQSQGHEIGGHTKTHPHLTALSLAQATEEITGGRNDLLALGATPINTFVFPFGDYNDQIEQIVRNAGYKGARNSDVGYNTKNTDKFRLHSKHIEANVTVDQIKSYINTAMAEKTWVILEAHNVSNGSSQYNITPANFQAVVDYLVQNNIPVVTMDQGLALLNP
jgi:peptidoglycan/xylan/chitin deacetylase (PgdA/CDA1 family)